MRSSLVANGSIRAIRLRGDRIMSALCGVLWLITLGLCPLYDTWIAWAVCSTFCFAVPLLLLWLVPATRGSRIGIGLCLMGFAAVSVYQMHGLIEAHFGFFILLGLLLYYRDWRPILISSLAVACHHLLFCRLQMNGLPVYIFRDNHSMSMVFVHATYVAAEAAALIFLTRMIRLEALESSAIAAFGERINTTGTLSLTFDAQRYKGPAARGLTHLLNAILGVSRHTGVLASRTIGIAETIASSSKRIVQLAEDKSRDAAFFRDAVQTMAESSAQIKADSAAVAQVATQSATIVSEGCETIQQAAALMLNVSGIAASTVSEIAQLQTESARIESIVEIMNDMANQSALLALNASIEAARAGEKGRGFHVLAQEIRTLSERSYDSLTEVQTIVETIRLRVAQLQIHADRCQASLVLGETQVTAAHRALTEVSQHLPTVAERVRRVVQAADHQAIVSTDVVAGVSMIGAVMCTVAEDVRRVAALSQSLEKISEELSVNVSQFQYDSHPGEPALA